MFFSRSRSSEPTETNWLPLESLEQWEDVLQESFVKPVVVFKHSTRCSVSFSAKRLLERDWDLDPAETPFYYLDLLSYRHISNTIAERLSVMHESPQLILIKDGKAIYHGSHYGIGVEHVKAAISQPE